MSQANATPNPQSYPQLLHALPAAIYMADAEGRITFFNEAAARLWGREPELGKELWCGSWRIYRTDGSPLPVDECPMAVAIREGRAIRGEEIVIERPDGTRRAVMVYPDPVRGPTGEVEGAVNMLIDVTDRRRVEDALRVSEERYRTVLSLLPAAVYTCDASTGVITYYNEHAAQLWGRAPRLGDTDERFCGSFRLWLADGTLLPHDRTPMARAVREERSFRNEKVVVERPDGTRIHVLVNIDPIRDESGRVVGAVNVFHDTTALALAEQALRDSEHRLREADRRKDEFIAMLSHELRNPLSALRNALAATLDEARRPRALAIAQRQTDHLARLVDDLLDLARITQGRISLRREPAPLARVLERAVEATRPLVAARGHRLSVSGPPADVRVDADPTRLEQVFVNLLANAAKYTDPGGDISVRVELERDEIIVRVADDGVGIAPDLLPQVFEPFAQADRSLHRQQGGLGIGLTLARRLVDLHGGRLSAHSEGVGKGSEFVVRLPCLGERRGERPRGAAGSARAPARRRARIVMVEDNRDAAESLRLLLEVLGHEVHVAHDGEAGLDAARASAPDVMLVDIGLPGLDGFEVARRVRGDRSLERVTLVALTGYGRDEDKRRSLEAGFDHHLVKPVDADTFVQLVSRLEPRDGDELAVERGS